MIELLLYLLSKVNICLRIRVISSFYLSLSVNWRYILPILDRLSSHTGSLHIESLYSLRLLLLLVIHRVLSLEL